MTKLFKLTALVAVLTTFAIFTLNADAGCRRSSPPRTTYRSPATQGPQVGGPGAPGGAVPGAPGAGGVAPGAPGAAGVPGAEAQPGAAGVAGADQGAQAGSADAGQDQQSVQTEAVSVPTGATITLPGNRGSQPGQVNLVLNGVRLPLSIVDWSETGVTVTLLEMQITSATSAELEIVVSGSDAETIAIQLQPQATVLVVQ